ncbi:MAG: bifunctional phosphopantothenoylcysteine decarboxylase/phosphopantothenate--cysteine ligase CoaBC [Flavobacteriales bacterium]
MSTTDTSTSGILTGKRIVLGVTGSIAAYKSAVLVRLLVKAGAEVRVVMTPGALDFTTPLTLATLSNHPVHSDFTESKAAGTWTNHVELGLWGDLMLIAPATANTLSSMAHGRCDNLLLAVYLSARCQVAVAPAMDLDMYAHSSTQENLNLLAERGVHIIDAEEGELASGLSGKGRMAEPEHIVVNLCEWLLAKSPLYGKRALVTAGPTHEPIDPVRFIGNHSSGKMGFAIAERLAKLGAKVALVTGPVALTTTHPNVRITRIQTAAEMLEACTKFGPESDIVVMSAAVADYRPSIQASQKIKKHETALTIQLEPTVDVLAELGKSKPEHQVLVGFALETNNEFEHAKGKLQRKNLDLIVLNSLNDAGAGFGHDTNKVTFIDRHNKISTFELKSKSDVAADLATKIIELCNFEAHSLPSSL